MIVHCKTVEEIEDVIKTESMNMYASPEKIFKLYGSNSCINNGSYGGLEFYKSYGYTITPYVEWKENKMKDQFIQLEGGKLNITKAKELGLFIEDKTVFTVDKCNGFSYKDYVVTCNEFNTVQILHENELILRLYKPTKYKVEDIFKLYGIEVDVI